MVAPLGSHNSVCQAYKQSGTKVRILSPGAYKRIELNFRNLKKRHFFVYKPGGLYSSKYGNSMYVCSVFDSTFYHVH